MKASDIINHLCNGITVKDTTCDTVKCGDPDRMVTHIGVTMVPTLAVLQKAAEAGVDLLVVHEPMFFDHMDVAEEGDPVVEAKRAILRESGMLVFRYHDHPHARHPDLIIEGAIKALGLTGELHDKSLFYSDTPLTARQLADRFTALGLAHVRMVGAVDVPMTHFDMQLGAPGSIIGKRMKQGNIELICVGETCEWRYAEYIRDAAALGARTAMLILGHAGCEAYGMELLARRLAERYAELTVTYIPCGEVYAR